MKSRINWIERYVVAIVFAFISINVVADDLAQKLYSAYSSAIYRIDVVTIGSEKKNSLGTGFVIGRDDVLASNFHVVASVVNEPERYKLEWQSVDGRRGSLIVLAVDVVHDLSLLKAEQSMGVPLVTAGLPEKGTELFSLGHPLALDLTIVPGTANGLLEKSIYEKIHFSGNINPGMSGGPALNGEGQVVGVNVASAGDAVGFLVPAKFLDTLLANNAEYFNTVSGSSISPPSHEALFESIGSQLKKNQQSLFDELLSDEWPSQHIGKFSVPDQISPRLECWGDTTVEKEDVKISEVAANCMGQDSIYLSQRQRAGTVSYQFFWLASKSLSSRSFYWLYQLRNNSRFMYGPGEDDVGNFTCSTHFIMLSGQPFKSNVCARPYLEYPELVDFMVLMAMTGHDKEGFLFTLDLSTVTLDNAMKLYRRFLENFSWQP